MALAAARSVGTHGRVTGVDLSGLMVCAAERRAHEQGLSNTRFMRMDAERLDLPDASVDVLLCALGLMYLPDPERAVREMRRVLRPGGRIAVSVWGERARCGWSTVFGIVETEVTSDACPLFFRLGQADALARLCADAKLERIEQRRLSVTLGYASADEACDAAFVGGPVALAWSRFDDEARLRVRARYAQAIAPWRMGPGYRIPGEFVIVTGAAPGHGPAACDAPSHWIAQE